MKKLTHTDPGGHAHMVDVGEKNVSQRVAKASGFISLLPETRHLIRENLMRKGDVLTIAEIAGVQAAKKTFDLIPLCHNIGLDHVQVSAALEEDGVTVNAEVHCTGKTGVEMEALMAVSIGLLTVYDMCKAVDKEMQIGQVRLIEKTKTEI